MTELAAMMIEQYICIVGVDEEGQDWWAPVSLHYCFQNYPRSLFWTGYNVDTIHDVVQSVWHMG
jgi:hypothetical protein